jgi:hypothetical protein
VEYETEQKKERERSLSFMDVAKVTKRLTGLTPEMECDQIAYLPPVTFAVFLIAISCW